MSRSTRCRLSLQPMENRLAPAVFTVTVNVTPGVGSLDEAISKANVNPGHDTVDFGPLFNLPQVIALANEIAITDSLTIIGTSAANVTIDGKNSTRIFNTTGAPSTAIVRFLELTLKQGLAAGSGGAILASNQTLTADFCNFDRNAATKSGGAVAVENGGSFTSGRCQYTSNTAVALGGAIHVGGGATPSCLISQSSFNANAADQGGAIHVDRDLQVFDSVIYSNKTSSHGGAIRMTNLGGVGNAFIRNSTLSGNAASGEGGGVAIDGTGGSIKAHNTTFTLNSSSRGGGIAVLSGNSEVFLDSTVISKNSAAAAPDVSTPSIVHYRYSALGSSLGIAILDNQGNNLMLNLDPKLDSLNNNGGPTLTHAFLSGCPLLNTGSNPGLVTEDQRGTGFGRTMFGATDIGAYEQQGLSIAPPKVISLQINDGLDQRSHVTSFRAVFSETMTFPDGIAAAFEMKDPNLAPPTMVALDLMQVGAVVIGKWYNQPGSVMIEPSGSLPDGRYRLTLFADKMMGEYGLLDGNGDSVPGDNMLVDLHRLFGDSNGDATVNSVDFANFRTYFGLGASIFDFDGDGQTNSSDFAEFRKRFGITLMP